tara:strand:- start:2483 stop:3208 length:726 start_codon:yes stop_codon:yes gene_type:complete
MLDFFDLLVVNLLNLILLNVVDVIVGKVKTLESEGRELGRLLEERLLKADSHTKLVINKPNLVEVNDGHSLLSLLDAIEGNGLLLHVIGLGDEGAVGLGENLELDSSRILLLTRANHRLVERLLEYLDVKILTEPFLRVLSYGVNDNLVELLELIVKSHSICVVGVERKVERIGSASSALISKRGKAIGRPHERKLNVELFVVAGVEVDGFTAILVLAKLRKLHGGRREIGRLLDRKRHCW